MPIDATNLFLSLAILQKNKGIAREKALAASVGAAMIPGVMGLVVPLAIARPGRSSSADSGPAPGTLTAVPAVRGMTQKKAEITLKNSGLTPLVENRYILRPTNDRGEVNTVVEQDPSANSYVEIGTEVTITVSLGPPPDDSPEDTDLDEKIFKDVEELRGAIADTKNQITGAKTEILAAITGKPPEAPKNK